VRATHCPTTGVTTIDRVLVVSPLGAQHLPVTTTTIPARPSPLSSRASRAQSSAIRDLLNQAKRPGMISLAGGLPDASLFPLAELSEIARRAVAEDGRNVLQYGLTQGDEAAREVLARRFGSAESGSASPDVAEVLLTTGSQQALDLLGRVLLDPGDVVVVSDPDYLGALQTFRAQDAELAAIGADAEGLDTERLEAELVGGLRPKFCYVVPHFHNPTGATMSETRRTHLAALSRRYGFLIVEDDPYRELYYEGPPPTEVASDPELTVRLRSTSKTLAPGLRIGALAGPRWLIDALVTAKQSTDLHTSSLSQAIVAHALEAPWYPDHLAALRSAYRTKRDVLVEALRETFGDRIDLVVPRGGMFAWAEFTDIEDTAAWLASCLDRGVCFVPGRAFAVDRTAASAARLSFATGAPDLLREGVRRLASAATAL